MCWCTKHVRNQCFGEPETACSGHSSAPAPAVLALLCRMWREVHDTDDSMCRPLEEEEVDKEMLFTTPLPPSLPPPPPMSGRWAGGRGRCSSRCPCAADTTPFEQAKLDRATGPGGQGQPVPAAASEDASSMLPSGQSLRSPAKLAARPVAASCSAGGTVQQLTLHTCRK